MRDFLWILSGNITSNLIIFLYVGGVGMGVWYATEDIYGVLAAQFITVIFMASLIARTSRVSLDMIGGDLKKVFIQGYNQAVADMTTAITEVKSKKETKDESNSA